MFRESFVNVEDGRWAQCKCWMIVKRKLTAWVVHWEESQKLQGWGPDRVQSELVKSLLWVHGSSKSYIDGEESKDQKSYAPPLLLIQNYLGDMELKMVHEQICWRWQWSRVSARGIKGARARVAMHMSIEAIRTGNILVHCPLSKLGECWAIHIFSTR